MLFACVAAATCIRAERRGEGEPEVGLRSVGTPRISIGPAGYRTESAGTKRGEAGLPRRVTPIGGPGTRVSASRQS